MTSNPFSPPSEVRIVPPTPGHPLPPDVLMAQERLRQHLADPKAVAVDRGHTRRLHPLVPVLLAPFAAIAALSVPGYFLDPFVNARIWSIICGATALLVSIPLALAFRDSRAFVDRNEPHDASSACDSYWRALLEWPEMSWATLAPSTREASTLDVAGVEFRIDKPSAFRRWTRWTAFIRKGHSGRAVIRGPIRIVELRDDYAVTEAPLAVGYHQPPPGDQLMVLLGFLLFAILGALIVARWIRSDTFWRHKRHQVRQRWIRGSNGAWYLLDPAGDLIIPTAKSGASDAG